MAELSSDRAFLGTGWGFPPAFQKHTAHVQMVSEADDIRGSLWILFSTTPGERLMHPTYGCPLKALVFENFTTTTETELRDVIARAILFFEPRISLEAIHFDTTEMYHGLLRIHLAYRIRAINSRHNLVYPFYYRDGTNVLNAPRG